MSDLISREALLEAHQDLVAFGTDTTFAVRNLITNAPAIEQCEVGKVYDRYLAASEHGMYLNTFYSDEELDLESKLYTTPQQPQSVADALEEVKTLVLDEKIAVSYQSIDGYRSSLLCAIRELIKRNTVKESE